jgi:AcrR family transcriptional regulator
MRRVEANNEHRGRGRPRIAGLREKILASATRLFGEKNFTEVSTEELAALAGVGKGSIYREFGSKESLYATTVIAGLHQLLSGIAATLKEVPAGPEAIKTVIRETTIYFWNHGEFFALLRDPTALPISQLRHFRQERAKLALLIAKVLQEGSAAGVFRNDLNAELVAEAILGMIRGIRRHRIKEITIAQAIATIEEIFLEGYLADVDEGTIIRRHASNMSQR